MAGKKLEEEQPDDDIYGRAQRQEQLDDDAIEPAEAGFMEGYGSPNMVQCRSCGKDVDLENAVEKEIGGKDFLFCSEKCAGLFEKRKASEQFFFFCALGS